MNIDNNAAPKSTNNQAATDSRRFKSGIAMTEAGFVQQFGGIYEHSPWIARAAWQSGGITGQTTVAEMARVLALPIDTAEAQQRLDLIRAHPDLADKAAQAGKLTAASTAEQASAGINHCNAQEFTRFLNYNQAYKTKFGFPFVMAVKGSNRQLILAAFAERLAHDLASELARAIDEIHKIARFRLEELAATPPSAKFHKLKKSG